MRMIGLLALIMGGGAAALSPAQSAVDDGPIDERPALVLGAELPDELIQETHPIGSALVVFTLDGRLVLVDRERRIREVVAEESPLSLRLMTSEVDATGDGAPDLHVIAWYGGWWIDHYIVDGREPLRFHHILDGQPEPRAFESKGSPRPRLAVGVMYQLANHTPCNRLGWGARVDMQWSGSRFRRVESFSSRSDGMDPSPEQDASLSTALAALLPRESASPRSWWDYSDAICMLADVTVHDLYGGQGSRAARRIEAVWPATLPGKDAFRCTLIKALGAAGERAWLERVYRRPLPRVLGSSEECSAGIATMWSR